MTPDMNNQVLRKSEIISCSRRTDVPGFLMEWVVDKIKKESVDVVNPFNKNIVSHVSLSPKDVKCWVWWSKNFGPWIEYYKKNESTFTQYEGHIFNFTINSRSELESGLKIPLEKRLEQAKWIISKFGLESLQWRFDPIVLYKKKTNLNNNRTLDNLGDFTYIAQSLSAMGVRDLIFSFATIYKKVSRRMEARGKIIIEPSIAKKKEILDNLIEICDDNQIKMHACCQPDVVGYKDITQAHCINGKKINDIYDLTIKLKPDKGQRDACGCTKSRDIGGYHGKFRCIHNCDYCYANPRKK
ncbi:MAG: DUF1848 family protein [Candidatus Lokiarchaeota archaeon]|nr:DUF1848 family protein [Candidatus Lokiarchaeota archaeon]